MKNYLNKGLLYAWFNSAKAPIGMGIFIWGFISHSIIKNNLWNVKMEIAGGFNNFFNTTDLYEYLMLGVIFLAIYCIAKGINKRNNEMFLSSSPYTKRQIRYNELICLLITLILFVIVYVYITFMSYISNSELISIVEGYWDISAVEVLKIFLFGIIGIIFMLIMDLMFSNSAIGFISMISIIPISIMMIITKVINMLMYVGIDDNYSLFNIIRRMNSYKGFSTYNPVILLERTTIKEISAKELLIEIIITLIIIVIMITIYNIVQKKYKLENYNKIFSSRANETVLVTLVSTGVGSFASLLFNEKFINSLKLKNGVSEILIGADLIKALGSDILYIIIIGFIAYKIIRRILKNIV